MKVVVAGSGPAGAFAALGALEAGFDVTMVDCGLTLEDDKIALKERLRSTPWRAWSAEDIRQLKKSSKIKTSFGSNFATRQAIQTSESQKGCRLFSSYALGGLSNIWGRGVEPPYAGEIDHWPFKNDFIDALKAVLLHLPLAGEEDNLAKVMPLYKANVTDHILSHDAQSLLHRWRRHTDVLNADGIHVGKLRVVMQQSAQNATGCQYCGMCYYGCAYDALWDSSQLVAQLQTQYPDRFRYQSGVLVTGFNSSNASVRITFKNMHSPGEDWLDCDRLILATGSLQTTQIVMRSLGIKEAQLKNSDLIMIPFLNLSLHSKNDTKKHALGQHAITIKQPGLSRKAVVVHMFFVGDLISDKVISKIPFFRPLIQLAAPIFRRLYIGMCFVHSDDSARIHIHDNGRLSHYESKRSMKSWVIYFKLLALFFKHIRRFLLLPSVGVGGVTLPGSSVHYGASLADDIDEHGALKKCPNVIIADAAALPDIAAGSYTLSIMANAYRVGKNLQ